MPSGKIHLVIGSAAALFATTQVTADPTEIKWIWIGPLAALLPDTDTRRSLLGRFIPLWLFFAHRRFTHSYVALALMTYGVWALTQSLTATVIAFTGYLSHIWLDWIFSRKRGVQLWWPAKRETSLLGIFRRR